MLFLNNESSVHSKVHPPANDSDKNSVSQPLDAFPCYVEVFFNHGNWNE
jgi:hypothetical protein